VWPGPADHCQRCGKPHPHGGDERVQRTRTLGPRRMFLCSWLPAVRVLSVCADSCSGVGGCRVSREAGAGQEGEGWEVRGATSGNPGGCGEGFPRGSPLGFESAVRLAMRGGWSGAFGGGTSGMAQFLAGWARGPGRRTRLMGWWCQNRGVPHSVNGVCWHLWHYRAAAARLAAGN
jgi:hypothetical protein